MIVNALRLIRKMRGGAQAHLIECDDRRFYVVKFRNNPQHRRILVNEWIASVFLGYLGIARPDAAIVNLSAGFLEANPDVHLQLGSRRIPPEPGWHFGSAHPGNPTKLAVYDFLPDTLLEKVANLSDFLGILAFDKWVGNADARQAIFYRAQLKDSGPAQVQQRGRLGFVASMMDHGYVFDGPHWNFPDSPLHGIYFRPSVYSTVQGYAAFQPWLDRIIHFPDEIVDDALKQLPPQWLEEDDDQELQRLLTILMKRRPRVPELIRQCSKGRIDPFPNWR